MDKPMVENCPPGLEYLTLVDQLIVKQQLELLESKQLFDHVEFITKTDAFS